MSFQAANSNKVAIGRVLPVVLAILFVGSADHRTQTRISKTAGRTVSALQAGERGIASRRTALCLLPALLGHAYDCSDRATDRFGDANVSAQCVHAESFSRLNGIEAASSVRASLAVPAMGQRPPPFTA